MNTISQSSGLLVSMGGYAKRGWEMVVDHHTFTFKNAAGTYYEESRTPLFSNSLRDIKEVWKALPYNEAELAALKSYGCDDAYKSRVAFNPLQSKALLSAGMGALFLGDLVSLYCTDKTLVGNLASHFTSSESAIHTTEIIAGVVMAGLGGGLFGGAVYLAVTAVVAALD